MELVIATHNIHKLREYRSLLKELPFLELFSLIDFPQYRLPPETGSSFEENSTQKALHAASNLKRLVIADDSGLVVPALKGAPGIFSARYAGSHATDKENRLKLLQEMASLKGIGRQAYFTCTIALASPEGLKKCIHGSCEGSILEKERGNQGFGYDCLFVKYEYNKTFAELDETLKNRISHRRKAVDKLLPLLQALREGLPHALPDRRLQSPL